jgi:hypothetical protein
MNPLIPRCSADSCEFRTNGTSVNTPTKRCASNLLILSHGATRALAQRTPVSPNRPWHGRGEARIKVDARNLIDPRLNFDPDKIYFFPELIDLAESQHRELLRRLARPTCLLVPKSA